MSDEGLSIFDDEPSEETTEAPAEPQAKRPAPRAAAPGLTAPAASGGP